jgi:hypothetical protein
MRIVRCTPSNATEVPLTNQPPELPVLSSTAEHDRTTRVSRSLKQDYSGQLEGMFCSREKYEPSRAYNSMTLFALSETQIVAMPQMC